MNSMTMSLVCLTKYRHVTQNQVWSRRNIFK